MKIDSTDNKSKAFNEAVDMDKTDRLNKYQNLFNFPQKKSINNLIYFSGNSLGLQPKNASKYVNDELDSWKNYAVEGHIKSNRPWLSYHELLTSYSAEIVGALDNEVVVMNSLTVNLHLLMVSFYRPKGKRKKILIENNAFPSDIYAIQSQLKFHGNDPNNDLIIITPEEGDFISNQLISEYLEKFGDEISLVLLGGVNYYTGQAFDIYRITDLAQNYGCRVGFDLAHAAGNIKLNLHDWGVDFASWCGYKYLNGGPGAPSGIFIHERHLNNNYHPRFEGWWGHDKITRFKMPDSFIPLKTAEAWQLSNPPIFSMASLLSSLEIFNKVGMEKLIEKNQKLTEYIINLINNDLYEKVKIITPLSKESRGCQLSFRVKQLDEKLIQLLYKNGIICDFRYPDVIRIAPVPLYNSFKDCYMFYHIFKQIIDNVEE